MTKRIERLFFCFFVNNLTMRKKCKSMEEVKNEVNALLGKSVKISVSKGRNKTAKYDGKVLFTYPNLFVLKIENNANIEQMSCSYKEVICGEIKLKG